MLAQRGDQFCVPIFWLVVRSAPALSDEISSIGGIDLSLECSVGLSDWGTVGRIHGYCMPPITAAVLVALFVRAALITIGKFRLSLQVRAQRSTKILFLKRLIWV